MKSALGTVHPVPVNGGDLALGPDHVTLRHLSILLIALAAASHMLQRERAPFARALGVVAGQAPDLESSAEAIVPKPAVHAPRLGISAEQLLAVC
jgi:hypothetical protein